MYLLFLVLPMSLKFAPNSSHRTHTSSIFSLWVCVVIYAELQAPHCCGRARSCTAESSFQQSKGVWNLFSMQHSAFCLSSFLSDLFAVLSFLSWCSLFILFSFSILPVLIRGYQNAHPSHLIIHSNSSPVNPA